MMLIFPRYSFCLLFAALVVALPALSAPRKLGLDSEVLEKLPQRAGDSTSRELSGLRAALAAAPTDSVAAERLARRYFDLAVARGDPRYVGYAEAVIAAFPGPLPPPLIFVRGLVRQYRHEFSGALEDFAAALAIDPSLAAAHAWRGAIFLVQADYVSAQKVCDVLAAQERLVLASGCRGLVLAYSGQLEAAYAELDTGRATTKDPENLLWLLTRLGEVAAWRNQLPTAEAHYRAALALGRDDTYLMAAWADFLLDAGRFDEVVTLVAPWEASDPLLLRLAEAQKGLKSADLARLVQALDERFAAARQRGDTTHQAEEARFYLRLRGNTKEAVRIAAENYRVQREPRDARILLEAAIAAKDAAAAAPVLDWLRRTGFEDQRMRRLAATMNSMVSQ